ncbi:hypothetical protein ABMC88_09135 [Sulfitobacter sp. HNIBRBA2951]|uniref:hypothetical protein n=1 Tax=Sulfitobacter aquimarinus TaxID=3158557 RepID=UPI0032DEDAA9
MTYLLTQMFLYLLVAFLLGLLLGWLLWRYGKPTGDEIDAMRAENSRLRSDLETCNMKTARLEAAADAPRAASVAAAPVVAPAPAVEAAPVAEAAPVEVKEASKPEGLSAPRGGTADELQLIHGVGPKMEGMLHNLGYYHFDQIANWTAAEVAWVDDNLEGFKGRVTRDKWQPQAKVLARG